MNVTDLINLLRVPTKTYHEEAMVNYIRGVVSEKKGIRFSADKFNNVYIIKGSGDSLPCVAAHIDSVQPLRNVTVHQCGNYLYGEYNGQPAGMGADDKTGVFVCLNLLDRFENIALALFAAEENGAYGASKADAAFFDKVGYVIEFDCPSRGMLSYSTGGVQLFANQGDFIKTAHPVLMQHGTTMWQKHPYTDTIAIRRRFPISCLNLSSGYYNWHMPNELVKLSDVEGAIEQATDLIQALGPRRYPFPPRLNEGEEGSLHPVTHLSVPKP